VRVLTRTRTPNPEPGPEPEPEPNLLQTRCCGSRGKLPKKLPRQPLPAAGSRVGGGGLFGTPLLSSLMLEYGGWVQRNA